MTPYPSARVLGLVLAAVCAAALCADAQAPSPDAQLAQARAQFEAGDYEPAIATLDPLIALLEPLAAKDPVAERLLPAAYELRARTRFQLGNADGATADFRALLKLAPGLRVHRQGVCRRSRRSSTTSGRRPSGRIVLNLSPVDAELELDGKPFTAAAGQIPLPVGPHTLSGRRSGCRSASQTFTVMPGASTEVVLTLERVSATVLLVTSPPGVEVSVDGVSRGRTEPGPQPPRWAEPIASLGVPAGSVSKPFVVDDLGLGLAHVRVLARLPRQRRPAGGDRQAHRPRISPRSSSRRRSPRSTSTRQGPAPWSCSTASRAGRCRSRSTTSARAATWSSCGRRCGRYVERLNDRAPATSSTCRAC